MCRVHLISATRKYMTSLCLPLGRRQEIEFLEVRRLGQSGPTGGSAGTARNSREETSQSRRVAAVRRVSDLVTGRPSCGQARCESAKDDVRVLLASVEVVSPMPYT